MKIKNRFDRVLKMLTVFAMTLSCFTDMPIRVVAESFDVDSVISIESHNNGTDANDSEASLAVSVTVNGQTVTAPKSVAPGTLTVRANEGYEIDSMILDGTEFNESTDVQAGEHSLNITAHSTASQSNESEEIQQPDPTVEPTPTITPDPTPEVSEDPKETNTPEVTTTPEVMETPEVVNALLKDTNKKVNPSNDQTRAQDKEYPIYVNAQQMGQSYLNHEVSYVPGQSKYNCQQDSYYGARDKHYVRIGNSGDPYEITYIRCDKYQGEDPDNVYYEVIYVNESQELLGREAVKKVKHQNKRQMSRI